MNGLDQTLRELTLQVAQCIVGILLQTVFWCQRYEFFTTR